MLASSSLGEEGVEAVVRVADGLVAGHGPVGLDTVLQAVELPAGIAHLDSGLTNMDRDTLTLKFKDGLVNENLGYLWQKYIFILNFTNFHSFQSQITSLHSLFVLNYYFFVRVKATAI